MCIPWSLPAFPLTTRHPDWCLLDVLEPKIAPPSTPSKFQPQFNLPVTSKQHQNSRSLPLLQASPRVYRFSFPCFYFYLWSISSCLAFGTPLGSATTDIFLQNSTRTWYGGGCASAFRLQEKLLRACLHENA